MPSLCAFQHCEADFNSDKNDVKEPIGKQVEGVHIDKSDAEQSEPNIIETDLESIDEENSTEKAVKAKIMKPQKIVLTNSSKKKPTIRKTK